MSAGGQVLLGTVPVVVLGLCAVAAIVQHASWHQDAGVMSTTKLVWGSGEEFGHKVMVSTADSVGKYDYGVAPLPINPMIIDEVKKAEAEQGKESKTLAAYAMVPADPPTHRFHLPRQGGCRCCAGVEETLPGLFSVAEPEQALVCVNFARALLSVRCCGQGKEPEEAKKAEEEEAITDDEQLGSQVSTLEVTQGQISSQSPTDATSSR